MTTEVDENSGSEGGQPAPAPEAATQEAPASAAESTNEVAVNSAPDSAETPEQEEGSVDVRGDLSTEYKIPEQFADKPWAKDIKSEEDLYAALDKSFNIPESSDGYEFSEVNGFSEDDYKAAKDLAHKAGLNQEQANKLLEAYGESIMTQNTQMYDQASMVEKLKEGFGESYEAKTKEISKVLKSYGGEQEMKHLMDLPNDHLFSVMKVVDNIVQSYGVESSDAPGEKSMGAGVPDSQEEKQKMRVEYFKELEGLKSKPHTEEEREAILKKIRSL